MAHKSANKRYSPPEVIAFHSSEKRRIKVFASVDIWAVGVIACEVLTGERAFPAVRTTPLPPIRSAPEASGSRPGLLDPSGGPEEELGREWRMGDAAKAKLEQMPRAKAVVMRCLAIDPRDRPSAEELVQMWKDVESNVPGLEEAEERLVKLSEATCDSEYKVARPDGIPRNT